MDDYKKERIAFMLSTIVLDMAERGIFVSDNMNESLNNIAELVGCEDAYARFLNEQMKPEKKGEKNA